MSSLIRHLAQFGAFDRQQELLCTRSLAYLLQRNSQVRAAVERLLGDLSGRPLPHGLLWKAEATQSNKARSDLEARLADGRPALKIEAKVNAPVDAEQLNSYCEDLLARAGGGTMVFLVPERKVREATDSAAGLRCDRTRVLLQVVTWEQVLSAMPADAVGVDTLKDLYFAFVGAVVPHLDTADGRAWRSDEVVKATWCRLVDRASRNVISPAKPLPMGKEMLAIGSDEHAAVPYYRRYLEVQVDGSIGFLSVGVKDPFKGYTTTPIWARVHCTTPGFDLIAARLKASVFCADRRLLESHQALWISIVAPASEIAGIEAVEAEIKKILSIATAS